MTSAATPALSRLRLLREASLPLSQAILMTMGVLLLVLGVVLVPVSLGLIAFSPDGQFGLLMVIMAIQMIALGETPLGQYGRSWAMIGVGLVFASLGIFSCIVPGILTDLLRILIGVLNIASGAVMVTRGLLARRHAAGAAAAPAVEGGQPMKRLVRTQGALAIVAIVFGVSMLVPGLVSAFVIAAILVVNGGLLFVLFSTLRRMQSVGPSP